MLYGFLGEYKAIVKLGLYTGKFLSSVTNNVPQPRGWYESDTHTHTYTTECENLLSSLDEGEVDLFDAKSQKNIRSGSTVTCSTDASFSLV